VRLGEDSNCRGDWCDYALCIVDSAFSHGFRGAFLTCLFAIYASMPMDLRIKSKRMSEY